MASDTAYNYRVLMVKRVSTGSFHDAFVFPGGVQEPQDPDLRTCAIRETYEETGLLLANPRKSAMPILLEGSSTQTFAELCREHSLELPECVEIGQWITPRTHKKRFDTRFFMLNITDNDQFLLQQLDSARPQLTELVSLQWFRPDEILEMNRRGEMALFPPQFYIFHELTRFTQWQDLVSRGSAIQAGSRVEPILCKRSDGAVIGLLPGDVLYRCNGPVGAADSATAHVDDADLFRTPDTNKQHLHRLVMEKASSGGFYGIRLLKTALKPQSKL
ncbi:hypothetical protein FB639_006253 [Coemansia asiatica]|nr:hypothetical protein FB639_006253 [Coemansia asiatica]